MKMNKHYNELKASYLFVDIAHKVAAYQEAHPEKEIIRLGIGDVTQPLAKCVVKAMHDAADEMGTKEGFHGYGPEQGYPFLKQAIQSYYAGRGTQLAEDEIFISDGAKSDLANVLGLFDVDNTCLLYTSVGDVEGVALAGIPLGVDAVERQRDLTVDVGPQGLLRPCGIHFAGRHIGNIIPEGDGHVPCGGCRLAQMHRDVLGDDDPAQHPGHAVLHGRVRVPLCLRLMDESP